jgi:hypothetical protein
MRHPRDRRSRSYFEINDYRKLREGELGDVEDVERISAGDSRKDSDETGNRNVGRSGYGDRDGFGCLSAASARDTRRRACPIVLTLPGEFVAGAWLPGDQRRNA